MGLSPFRTCFTNYNQPAPNPNPGKWVLLNYRQYPNGYALKVRYLDCTNFEGVKVMVFKGKFRFQEYLDPHFQDSDESPVARFRPDDWGWDMAIKLAQSL
jgi:hypothetical protein